MFEESNWVTYSTAKNPFGSNFHLRPNNLAWECIFTVFHNCLVWSNAMTFTHFLVWLKSPSDFWSQINTYCNSNIPLCYFNIKLSAWLGVGRYGSALHLCVSDTQLDSAVFWQISLHHQGQEELIWHVRICIYEPLLSGCCLIPHYSTDRSPIKLTLKWIVDD